MRAHDLPLGLTDRAAYVLVAAAAAKPAATPATAGTAALSGRSDAETAPQVRELLAGGLDRRLRIRRHVCRRLEQRLDGRVVGTELRHRVSRFVGLLLQPVQ